MLAPKRRPPPGPLSSQLCCRTMAAALCRAGRPRSCQRVRQTCRRRCRLMSLGPARFTPAPAAATSPTTLPFPWTSGAQAPSPPPRKIGWAVRLGWTRPGGSMARLEGARAAAAWPLRPTVAMGRLFCSFPYLIWQSRFLSPLIADVAGAVCQLLLRPGAIHCMGPAGGAAAGAAAACTGRALGATH